MILSHTKQFIFIHNGKVAGKSIKAVLEPYNSRPYKLVSYLGVPRYLGYKPKLFSSCFHYHVTANKLHEELPPKVFQKYFKFAFVRNPWDREVSRFFYIRKSADHAYHEKVNEFPDFETYVEWLMKFHKEVGVDTQLSRLTNHNGQVLVDFIGKFENLQEDFDFVCKKIGIPEAHLPEVNTSEHKPYRSYYSEQSKNIIGEIFKPDINFFGYAF